MDAKKRHETFLYPVVRVFSQGAAGSGTLIYSEPNPEEEGEFITLVLTNHHVIADLIAYKKDWDSVLKKEIKKEFIEFAKVEVFDYDKLSIVDSSKRYNAEVVAYDEGHDLAILRVMSARQFPHVAKIIPRDDIKTLKLLEPGSVCVSGCSMAHDPFCNFGELTYMNEVIDRKKYLMCNAGSIFGNSGGALFWVPTGELIGVPSRVSGIQIGFGMDIITWMGFSAHPDRLYEFFDQQELMFIYDPEDTYHAAMERREKLVEKAKGIKDEDGSRSGGECLD